MLGISLSIPPFSSSSSPQLQSHSQKSMIHNFKDPRGKIERQYSNSCKAQGLGVGCLSLSPIFNSTKCMTMEKVIHLVPLCTSFVKQGYKD